MTLYISVKTSTFERLIKCLVSHIAAFPGRRYPLRECPQGKRHPELVESMLKPFERARNFQFVSHCEYKLDLLDIDLLLAQNFHLGLGSACRGGVLFLTMMRL